MRTINIVGDTHNIPALKKILSKLDNVFSLGDIVPVNTQEYLKNICKYSKVWRAYANKDFTGVRKDDVQWFFDINTSGWLKQLDLIKSYNGSFYVNRGNSDYRLLSLFKEMRNSLRETKKSNLNFHFIEEPEYIKTNNTGVIFLPYRDGVYTGIDRMINTLSSNCKLLLVLGHCPLYKEHEKEYYVHHFEVVKRISRLLGEVTYIHGHVHPDNTYRYSSKELPHVTIITPKAEDCSKGMGFNHEYLEIDTISTNIIVKEIDTGKLSEFKILPPECLKRDHWNKYFKPNTEAL